MVLLTTTDNQEFRVDKDIATRSIIIQNKLNAVGGDEETAIPINVTGPVFQKILDYCEHHRGDADEDSFVPKELLAEWDENYVNSMDKEMLMKVSLASFFLQIRPLSAVINTTITTLMKGKTPEQIRDLFNTGTDFTPEEHAQFEEHVMV